MPESKSSMPTKGDINLNGLGTYLDGWADLAEGMGDKRNDVLTNLSEKLIERNMPDVDLSGRKAYAGELDVSGKRLYIISKINPGATTTVYVGKHGNDLYISWRSFIKPILNAMIAVIIVIALLIGAGAAHRVNSWIVSDIQVFVAAAIVAVIVETALVAGLGFYLKKDPFAFFFKQVTILDAEDITAMNITIHKTIIRALDNTGIDVKKLRIKEKFSGGRKGEDI